MNVKAETLVAVGATSVALLLAALQGWAVAAVAVIAAIGSVAFSAQCFRERRSNDELYRPVYVRSATGHRRVMHDDR